MGEIRGTTGKTRKKAKVFQLVKNIRADFLVSQCNSNEDKRPELSVSLYINLPLHFKRKCILKRTSIAGEFLGFKLFFYR